jgi:FkbM family methyltransferase
MRKRRPLVLRAKRLGLFVTRFGPYHGLRLLRQLDLPSRDTYAVDIPGLSRPLLLRPNGTDARTIEELFLDRDYELPFTINPTLIVDAGAHAGYASVYFAHAYPSARIIAIEPDEGNLRLLRANTRWYPQVEIIRGALWPRPGRARIANPSAQPWAYRVEAGTGDGGEVDAITVPDVLQRAGHARVDLLKLDVEGCEREIFSDCGSWIDRVGALVVELHDRLVPGCQDAMEAALAGRQFDRWRKGANAMLRRQTDVRPKS